MKQKYNNILGKKYGRLTAVERLYVDKKTRRYVWKFECDCGNFINKIGSYVTTKHTTSCGCYAKEVCKTYLDPSASTKAYGESSRRVLYLQYKHNAKKRNIEFKLLYDDFKELISMNCVYCGIKPSKIFKQKSLNGHCVYNGIDRVDNSVGYIKVNCATCCQDCNLAKRGLTKEYFLTLVKRIALHNKLTEMSSDDKIELEHLREMIANNKASDSSGGWGD